MFRTMSKDRAKFLSRFSEIFDSVEECELQFSLDEKGPLSGVLLNCNYFYNRKDYSVPSDTKCSEIISHRIVRELSNEESLERTAALCSQKISRFGLPVLKKTGS